VGLVSSLAIDLMVPISSFSTTPRVYQHLLSSEEWVDDIHAADIIFVSAHSQGCIVSTHLVDLLIRDGHVITSSTGNVGNQADNSGTEALDGVRTSNPNPKGRQRICCLSLCGIHLGPLRYLKLSSFIQPYIQVGAAHWHTASRFSADGIGNPVFRKPCRAGDIPISGAFHVSCLCQRARPGYSGSSFHLWSRIRRTLYQGSM
jgi:hypothetical protein